MRIHKSLWLTIIINIAPSSFSSAPQEGSDFNSDLTLPWSKGLTINLEYFQGVGRPQSINNFTRGWPRGSGLFQHMITG